MITTINENIRIWQEFNPIELSLNDNHFNSSDSKRNLAKLGFNKERIAIKDRWFDVLTPSELVRKWNKSDGYYGPTPHAILVAIYDRIENAKSCPC